MVKRGKLKYKDVVGGGKGKQRKNTKKIRPRKTYRLYKNDQNKSNFKKRKFHNVDKLEHTTNTKRQKYSSTSKTVASDLYSESEDENEVDPLTQLRQMFNSDYAKNRALAIDSSDEFSESENGDKINENIDDDNKTEEIYTTDEYDAPNEGGSIEAQDLNTSDEENNISAEETDTTDEYDSPNEDGSIEAQDLNTSDEENNISEEEEDDQETYSSEGSGDEDSISEEEASGNIVDDEDIERDLGGGELEITIGKEEIDNSKDPFVEHLHYDLHDSLLDSLQSTPIKIDTFTEDWPQLGKLYIQVPKGEEAQPPEENKFNILERKIFASNGKPLLRIKPDIKPLEVCLKTQLMGNLKKANKALDKESKGIFTPLQSEIFSIINNYQDIYYPYRTFDNATELRYVYCLHAANHILKTRTKVLHHNARLANKEVTPDEFRDQGLVRPKILFVVPFKDSAYKIVQLLIDILLAEDKGNVMNKKRFIDEYTGNEIMMPKKNPKPEDYEHLFTGNTSDDFRVGITVTKKSLKLYANFYSSDIIVASPLGLRTIIGAEREPERDYDFLASLELLIFDQTEIFLMQNWDHVLHILNHLHLQPKESHVTDFSRVRMWSLNGWSKYYRQTLIFSSVVLPEINSIFNKRCLNYAGKVQITNPIELGVISQVVAQVPHVFQKFSASSVIDAIEGRFNFFVSNVLPQQRDVLMKQTLIMVANYFDYVRLRNYFKREDIGFVQICEYSREGKIARARDMFFHGDVQFMLYTERYHFFNRIRIKGIRHLVFYQPPNFPHFYYEMCNLMLEANMNRKIGNMSNMSVTVLYSKYDALQLSAIVGTDKAIHMVQSDRNVHMMVTGAK